MLFAAGICLIAVAIAMILVGRPADGVAAPWLKNWVVGQSYALGAMTSGVLGVCFTLSDLPI